MEPPVSLCWRLYGYTFPEVIELNWRDRIGSDPEICHGKVCVVGTRIMVSVVLANLAHGDTFDQIIASYPSLTNEDIQACLAYAAEIAGDPILSLPRSA